MPHKAKCQQPVGRKLLHSSVSADKTSNPSKPTKKKGGGGRFTWGRVGDEFIASDHALDEGDPNYDPDDKVCVLEVTGI